MSSIHLIMPMGGAGSRFFNGGFIMPKPLIEINNKPFFFWATQSIYKFVDISSLIFVVLQEHVKSFDIDSRILEYYPDAKIHVIPQTLKGAVLTCLESLNEINDDKPLLFNDCDHMYYCNSFNNFCKNQKFDNPDGALLTFSSNNPKYSFLEYDSTGKIIKTVEKKAISNNAICGAYYFKNATVFKTAATSYLNNCVYKEYFISGVYNEMVSVGLDILGFTTDFHISFGTPEEYDIAKNSERFKDFL